MTATTDANWAPLEAKLRNDIDAIREFMWMYGDEATRIEYYKHSVTRRYLLLHRDGRCFQHTKAASPRWTFSRSYVECAT
jgi:hypothetical protein